MDCKKFGTPKKNHNIYVTDHLGRLPLAQHINKKSNEVYDSNEDQDSILILQLRKSCIENELIIKLREINVKNK